jgi:hypothetical protein
MRKMRSESAMPRSFFRTIGHGATGPGNKQSRIPKNAENRIVAVRKGLAERCVTARFITLSAKP